MTSLSANARIRLDTSKAEAEALLSAHRDGDRLALDRIRWNVPRFRGESDAAIQASDFSVEDAQLVVARHHHLASWAHLLDYVREIERPNQEIARFEAAADAIVTGNFEDLRQLLAQHPELIHQRSTRAHHSTLLHYVSANGVEDYRQVTPANILDIARLLLDHGAEVDATSNAYGGGSTTLGLVSTSAHPRARGKQIALIDLLLEFGARIDGEDDLQQLVRGAIGNGCPEAAVALASRGAHVNTLYASAGVGNLDRVRALFPEASQYARESALIVAAQQGHAAIVTWLLDHGVDIAASDGMTALHNASAGGYREIVQMLVARGAPLEALNEYGGTVLSSTVWFAHHVTDDAFRTRDLSRVIEFLVAAGARIDIYPELAADIAGVTVRARALAQLDELQ